LAGPSSVQTGIEGDGVVMPALVDAAPAPEPYPPLFGLVGTLQNVAVISSWQITPVLGRVDVFV
jgi:hypothetical protein